MRQIINKDKTGKVIPDLTKVEVPKDLEQSVFKVLNPTVEIEGKAVSA